MKSLVLCSLGLVSLLGCSTHHWAPIEATSLPPPDAPVVRHTSRVFVDVSRATDETQCVVDDKHHPVCFYNLRPALELGLARTLWPSFPEIILGNASQANEHDYVLQVDLLLDALPPDDQGPGWSAGVRGRFRLLRNGVTLLEETTAARSRSHFPYGGPLGEGATEAMDATVQHIAQAVFSVPENQPDQPVLLPQVVSRVITAVATRPDASSSSPHTSPKRSAAMVAPSDSSSPEPDLLAETSSASLPPTLAKSE